MPVISGFWIFCVSKRTVSIAIEDKGTSFCNLATQVQTLSTLDCKEGAIHTSFRLRLSNRGDRYLVFLCLRPLLIALLDSSDARMSLPLCSRFAAHITVFSFLKFA